MQAIGTCCYRIMSFSIFWPADVDHLQGGARKCTEVRAEVSRADVLQAPTWFGMTQAQTNTRTGIGAMGYIWVRTTMGASINHVGHISHFNI